MRFVPASATSISPSSRRPLPRKSTTPSTAFRNLKGLVFDLRGNPGGLLSQAVEVCDHLLAKGQNIVSQRGRAYPDQNYTATHGNDGKTFPIVVLVNRNTASAAEIVSGALQDHDRALIVGETTFGKGLVQTVYNLSENTGLALTTYHYYTPSGRLIQRNYTGVSLYDYYYNHAGAIARTCTNREVKFTDSGRTVYGGGGITPDEKIDSPKSNKFQEVARTYTRRVLPLRRALSCQPHRRQKLPGRRRRHGRIQTVPHQPGHSLDRKRYHRQSRIG